MQPEITLRLDDIARGKGITLDDDQRARVYDRVRELGRDPAYCRSMGISEQGMFPDDDLTRLYERVLGELRSDAQPTVYKSS